MQFWTRISTTDPEIYWRKATGNGSTWTNWIVLNPMISNIGSSIDPVYIGSDGLPDVCDTSKFMIKKTFSGWSTVDDIDESGFWYIGDNLLQDSDLVKSLPDTIHGILVAFVHSPKYKILHYYPFKTPTYADEYTSEYKYSNVFFIKRYFGNLTSPWQSFKTASARNITRKMIRDEHTYLRSTNTTDRVHDNIRFYISENTWSLYFNAEIATAIPNGANITIGHIEYGKTYDGGNIFRDDIYHTIPSDDGSGALYLKISKAGVLKLVNTSGGPITGVLRAQLSWPVEPYTYEDGSEWEGFGS